MNIFRRTLITIKRQWGKHLLLFLLSLIIGTVISVTYLTYNFLHNLNGNFNSLNPTVITMSADSEDISYWGYSELEHFLNNELQNISNHPSVLSVNYSFITTLHHLYFRTDALNTLNVLNQLPPSGVGYAHFDFVSVNQPNIIYLEYGEGELIEGRTFSALEIETGESVIVVSEDFARYNEINVGDIITFSDVMTAFGAEYTFEVIGVWGVLEVQEMFQNNFLESNRDSRDNRFFIPVNKGLSIIQDFSNDPNIQIMRFFRGAPIFILDTEESVEGFLTHAEEVLSNEWTFTHVNNRHMIVQLATNGAMSILFSFFIPAILIFLVIYFLISLLFLHDRKAEIKIYVALGEYKFKIKGQILLEMLITGFLAFSSAFVIASTVVNRIGQELLMRELDNFYRVQNEAQSITFDTLELDFGFHEVSISELMNMFQAEFTFAPFIGLLMILMIILLLSTLVMSFYFARKI